jgi:glycyl-tRNA synthetase beta chain
VADKLDTLRGCFRVGLIPTGSRDPFALRRAAQGVVKILVEAKLDYYVDQLATGELRDFLAERIQHYFREVRGFKYDEVNAVLKVGISTLKDVDNRLQQIAEVRSTPNFEPLAASFKRINNILKQAGFTEDHAAVDTALLEPGPEKELYEAYSSLAASAPLTQVADLRPTVDQYFNKVMVNAEDPNLRRNRLSMLSQMLRKFSTIADFSEIVTSGDQKS